MKAIALFCLTTLIGILLFGCASVDVKTNDSNALASINDWTLSFRYESGSVEKIHKDEGNSQVRVLTQGQDSRHLALRDDLFFILRDDYNINVVSEETAASGKIQLHAIDFERSSGFSNLRVQVISPSGETLARLNVQNGDRNATFLVDRIFTDYAAEAIAAALGVDK